MPRRCRPWTENRRRFKVRKRLEADKLRMALLRKYPDMPPNQISRPSLMWAGNSQGGGALYATGLRVWSCWSSPFDHPCRGWNRKFEIVPGM